MTARCVIVVGNPKPQSRTLQAARSVVSALASTTPDREFDLVEFGAALLDWDSAEISSAVAEVERAELVVVASPTYKGSYIGLLKVFLDRFAAGSLRAVTAIPLMLGADLRHSLAPEVFLKPVLAELGASTPTRGLFLLDRDYADPSVLDEWLAVAREQLPASLRG